MFGEQTPTVLYGDVESSPVELHERDRELKAEWAERWRTFTPQQTPGKYKSERWHPRLVVNWVQVSLERVSFPPAWPPFVRKEVEADVRVRAMVGEGDQVPAEGETHFHINNNNKNTW